jgi:hypothetical protein
MKGDSSCGYSGQPDTYHAAKSAKFKGELIGSSLGLRSVWDSVEVVARADSVAAVFEIFAP